MATSRPIPHIMNYFHTALALEIRASDTDVRNYLETQLPRLPHCVRKDRTLQETIVDGIAIAIDGMFLLARLHLDSLEDKTTAKAIKRTLEKLPRGSDALDSAYDDALKRINDQRPGFRDLAIRTLSWATFAERLLEVNELRYALAIDVDENELDEENINDIEDIISACAGLVTVERADDQPPRTKLLHFSTQEYLTRKASLHLPDARRLIAFSCMAYLDFEDFEWWTCVEGRMKTVWAICDSHEEGSSFEDRLKSRLQDSPLFQYSAQNFRSHAINCAQPGEEKLLLSVLKDDSKISSIMEFLLLQADSWDYRFRWHAQRLEDNDEDLERSRAWTAMHVIAYFGLNELMAMMFDQSFDPDVKDCTRRSPLAWAADQGHEALVKILSQCKDVDVNSKDHRRRTPLHFGAQQGSEASIGHLLNCNDIDVESRDELGQTPLMYAAKGDCEKTVRVLLDHQDVNADSKDEDGRTPLSHAAQCGSAHVAKILLLRQDVDADSRDKDGKTPLSHTAKCGRIEVMEILLRRQDVDANSRDDNGRTPLSYAAEEFSAEIVNVLLLRSDVAADSRDNDGRTPLSHAAGYSSAEIVNIFLLRSDVDADSRDNDGRSPLSYAVQGWQYFETVQPFLMRHDVNPDSRDKKGRTPLSHAASGSAFGYLDEPVLKLLLSREDVDPYSKDQDGNTPLSYAAKVEQENIFEQLLEERHKIFQQEAQ